MVLSIFSQMFRLYDNFLHSIILNTKTILESRENNMSIHDSKFGKVVVVFNDKTEQYNVCEYQSGPYCPMHGGRGDTIDEAIVDYELNYENENKRFDLYLGDAGNDRSTVINYLREQLNLTTSQALNIVNKNGLITKNQQWFDAKWYQKSFLAIGAVVNLVEVA